jgi:hypothetical protein
MEYRDAIQNFILSLFLSKTVVKTSSRIKYGAFEIKCKMKHFLNKNQVEEEKLLRTKYFPIFISRGIFGQNSWVAHPNTSFFPK